jgi:hypothetical protein
MNEKFFGGFLAACYPLLGFNRLFFRGFGQGLVLDCGLEKGIYFEKINLAGRFSRGA